MANVPVPQFPFPAAVPPMPASLPGDLEKMMSDNVEKHLLKTLEHPSDKVKEAFWCQIKDTIFSDDVIHSLKRKFGAESKECDEEHFCPWECFMNKVKGLYISDKSQFELEDEIMSDYKDLTLKEKRVLGSFIRCHFPKMLSMNTDEFFETVESLGKKFHMEKDEKK